MSLAAAHIPLVYSIGPAILALALVVWYWLRLSAEDVPSSRRRIRRVSLAIIAVTIPLLLTALSVVDPSQQASAYVIVWSLCGLCLMLIVTTAIADAINNLRLHRQARHDQMIHTAAMLFRASPPSESRGGLLKDTNNGSGAAPGAEAGGS